MCFHKDTSLSHKGKYTPKHISKTNRTLRILQIGQGWNFKVIYIDQIYYQSDILIHFTLWYGK